MVLETGAATIRPLGAVKTALNIATTTDLTVSLSCASNRKVSTADWRGYMQDRRYRSLAH